MRRLLAACALSLALIGFVGCHLALPPTKTSAPTLVSVSTEPPTLAATQPAETPLAPTATSVPTATTEPLRLAVDAAIYDASADLWTALSSEMPDLVVVRGWQAGVHAEVLYAFDEPEDAVELASEPWVWVCHLDAGVDDVSWDRIAELHAHGWTLLAPAECHDTLAQKLPGIRGATAATPEDAVRIAARDRHTLALVPWSAVSAEVRVCAMDGQRLEPPKPGDWPTQRRLVIRGIASHELIECLSALAPAESVAIELVAVGDVMLARGVGERIATEGVRYPYEGEGIAELLQSADVTFANLECAVSDGGTRQSKAYTFCADPATLAGLAWAGIDVVSLANNHTCDYGRDAVIDTVRLVEQAGIMAVGAGQDAARAREPQIHEVGGMTLAWLAYNQIGPRWMDATADRAGSAYMDAAAMLDDVQAADERADLVIVSCHWGVEHSNVTTAYQRDLTQRLWDAGADLVLGHHPHVVQAIAVDGRRAAVYSMGNFVFDMSTPGSRDGYALRCLLDASGCKQIELVPYKLSGYRPHLLDDAESATAVERVHQLTGQAGGWPK